MDLWLSILTGLMVAAGSYLMMSGTMLRFLLGLVLVSNAVNLIIFIAGRMTFAGAPFITKSLGVLTPDSANPVPQALILTAIVIGFGLFAFALSLALRAYTELGTDDGDEMREAEPREPQE
ncbi:MAG: Na+/H+ antiporter subunit C [Litorivicinus sp.]